MLALLAAEIIGEWNDFGNTTLCVPEYVDWFQNYLEKNKTPYDVFVDGTSVTFQAR